MKNNARLIEQKSLLSRLMAQENITVHVKNVETAYFDLKNRVLVLPSLDDKLSAELCDMYTSHEVGHGRWTPFLEWTKAVEQEKIPQSLLNIIEDARIEKLIQRKYPGLKCVFYPAWNELRTTFDCFGLKRRSPNIYGFIDRLNIHFKCGIEAGVDFSEEEMVYVDKAKKLESFRDTTNLCRELIQYEKEQESKKKEEKGGGKGNTPTDGEGNSLEISLEESSEMQGNSKIKVDDAFLKMLEDSILTDKLIEEVKKKLNKKGEVYNVTLPEIDLEEVIISYNRSLAILKNWRPNVSNEALDSYTSLNKPMILHMVKEFQIKKNATQLTKVATSKTGDLDLKKVYSYKYSEDLFKRISTEPKGKSHGLVIFLDWSGSMNSILLDSIIQIFCITDFCKKSNIPFDVYFFENGAAYSTNSHRHNRDDSIKFKAGDLDIEAFHLVQILSNKMLNLEYTEMKKYLLYLGNLHRENGGLGSDYLFPKHFHTHGTPLNSAIIAAMDIIPKFKREYNLDIVNTIFVTDGDSNDIYGYRDDNNFTRSFGSGDPDILIRNPKSGHSIKQKRAGKFTPALLLHLREHIRSNVVGFFLSNYGVQDKATLKLQYPGISNDAIKSFIDDGFAPVTSEGYTEFYVIDSNRLKLKPFQIEVNEKGTLDDMGKSFVANSEARMKNRILLSRFIDLIA